MAYVISEDCTKCGACESACPQEAIAKCEDKCVIDTEKCVDCGQCVDQCPNSAIAQMQM
jgi:ferredoxin